MSGHDDRGSVQLQVTVFSKDRPAQLELLLRSLKRFWGGWGEHRITVLYAATSDDFARGYKEVRAVHPEFSYVSERDSDRAFREHVLALMGFEPYVAYLVDDNVFTAPFDLARPEFRLFAADPEIMALSLRMGPHMDYCYPADLHSAPPPFERGTVWEWRGLDGDWGYPMSLDGHVFRTAELRPLIEATSFANPNTLEEALALTPLPNPKLVCLPESVVANIPANRVQTMNQNRHTGGSAERLNGMFLAGARLDLEPLVGLRGRAPHTPVALRWQGLAWRLRGTETMRQRARRAAARVIGSVQG
jgi:hypothetical protein